MSFGLRTLRPCHFAGTAEDPRCIGSEGFEFLLNQATERAPLHELIDIDDVGFACAYLATDFAKRITGGTIYINGGANIIG